jgi:plasmid maintenance system antidote protein VapI
MGITQKAAAEALGISVRQLQRFGAGDNKIPPTVIKLLKCLLEVAKR